MASKSDLIFWLKRQRNSKQDQADVSPEAGR